MAIPVKRFPINKQGRDFIVGDIHGAYALVEQALRAVRFDRRRDRLFSVGDLIDRGPESKNALKFIKRVGAHAVRGNHDHDFASLSLADIRALGASDWNGLGWVLDQTDSTLAAVARKLGELPMAMEIQTLRGRVGIVHGEVPIGMDWSSFTQALEAGEPSAVKSALWGRSRSESAHSGGVRGIDRIFCGHTIQWNGPARLGNIYFIDTGAVFNELGHDMGNLTMANLMCGSQKLSPRSPGEPREPVAIFNTNVNTTAKPFGSYSA